MVDAILNFFRQLIMGIKDMIFQYDQQLQATKTPRQRWITWIIIVVVIVGVTAFILSRLGAAFLSVMESASNGATSVVQQQQ